MLFNGCDVDSEIIHSESGCIWDQIDDDIHHELMKDESQCKLRQWSTRNIADNHVAI